MTAWSADDYLLCALYQEWQILAHLQPKDFSHLNRPNLQIRPLQLNYDCCKISKWIIQRRAVFDDKNDIFFERQ